MTLLEVLQDTRNRFSVGDDSRANMQDAITALRDYFPESLSLTLPDAAATSGVTP